MKIGIIDADLLGRKGHRFPNLACEKMSSYFKSGGATVDLILDYDDIDNYDEVYISRVFTDTWVPEWIENAVCRENATTTLPGNIHVGGTGFYFDHAPNLPEEIEHHMPDYSLYDEWIEQQVAREKEKKGDKFKEKQFMVQFKEYTDYSIGFMTRGCFRKCPFCVNQKYNKVELHSPLEEFYDPSKKKICLLDDNVLGNPHWREIWEELIATGKPFKFKQGLDERLLTDEKCEMIFNAKYDGFYTFAFDNIEDYDLIHEKLKLIRRHTDKQTITFYVLVGFKSTDLQDIIDMFERIALLIRYNCVPYIMKYRGEHETPWEDSEFRTMYISVARWCNQPGIFKKKSFRQYIDLVQSGIKTPGFESSALKAFNEFEARYPEIAAKYFDLRYDDYLPK